MSVNDPRKYLKDILIGVTATKDDDATAADIIVLFEGGPETFMHLFYIDQYDCVISLGRHRERESGPEKRTQGVPLRYEGEVPIYTAAIDKTGITATKLLNKVRRSIIATVEANAFGPFLWASRATSAVQSSQDNKAIIGGFDPLFSDSFWVAFKPHKEEG